jgi:hypothetical protein
VRTAPADQEIHDFQQDVFLLIRHRTSQSLQPGKDGFFRVPSLRKSLTKALTARSASSWPLLLFNIRTISSSSLNATPSSAIPIKTSGHFSADFRSIQSN